MPPVTRKKSNGESRPSKKRKTGVNNQCLDSWRKKCLLPAKRKAMFKAVARRNAKLASTRKVLLPRSPCSYSLRSSSSSVTAIKVEAPSISTTVNDSGIPTSSAATPVERTFSSNTNVTDGIRSSSNSTTLNGSASTSNIRIVDQLPYTTFMESIVAGANASNSAFCSYVTNGSTSSSSPPTLNGNASTSNISMKSEIDMTTDSTTRTSVTLHQSVITASQLHNVIGSSTRITYLLIDCRSMDDFNLNRIMFSVNASLNGNPDDFIGGFNRRSDVLKYLLDWCSKLTEYLSGPGFYRYIVVYDEESTLANLPSPIKTLMKSIEKWNEGMKTTVCMLEEGFKSFSERYGNCCFRPDLVQLMFSFPSTTSEDPMEMVKRLEEYDRNLVAASNTIKYLVCTNRKLKSLKAMKLALMCEQKDELKILLDKIIPVNFRCPGCSEIFNGEIYQCEKGHNVCLACSESQPVCPNCQVPFGSTSGKVPNRFPEEWISKMGKTDCPYSSNGCAEKLSFGELSSHASACGKKTSLEEAEKIDGFIASTNQKILEVNRQFEVLNLRIAEDENYLISGDISSVISHIPNCALNTLFGRIGRFSEGKKLLLSQTFVKDEGFPPKNFFMV